MAFDGSVRKRMNDAWGPFLAPATVGAHDISQIMAFLGETIDDRERFCADDCSLDETVLLEVFQSPG